MRAAMFTETGGPLTIENVEPAPPGPRDVVRDRAAKTALQLARWTLRGEDAPIIWERR